MPKIEAATVAEHRAQMQGRLIHAAEELLKRGEPLTAGAVSRTAGIARNSIYRYVGSVEELRELVIARYLPAWIDAVMAELATASGPAERIELWVSANLERAATSGHGWLMAAQREAPTPVLGTAVDEAHASMRAALSHAWRELLPDDDARATIAVALTMGLLEAGFRELEAGRSAALVRETAAAATRGMITALVRR